MRCLYCQEWCSLIHGPNRYHGSNLKAKPDFHWKCQKCQVYLWADSHTFTRIKFTWVVLPKTYYLELYPQHNRTHLHYQEPYPQKFTFGGIEPDIQETLLDLPYLLDSVTPQNLKEKINYLLTFL